MQSIWRAQSESGHFGFQCDNSTKSDRWYAVSVRQRAEKITAACLEVKGYAYLLPTRKVRRRLSDRVKVIDQPLFPGYVFCKFDARHRLALLTTPGVISVVGLGREPAPVTDSEIEAISRIVDAGVPAEQWPFVEAGQRVEIASGTLKGLEGVVVRCNSEFRVVVSVTLLRRSVAVQVDRNSVRLLESAAKGL